MTLDNGATDGYSDSHTVIFSCVERFEEPVGSLRIETDPRIFHAEEHPIAFVSFGPDQQLPRAIMDSVHRIRSIPQEVQNYLLQLHAVTCDKREVAGKLRSQNHPASLKLTQRQSNYLSRSVIQIHPLSDGVFFAEECSQSRDHIRRTVAIANRSPGGFSRTVDIWRFHCQHPQTGAGVSDDT